MSDALPSPRPSDRRGLSLVDALGIGVNGIVGSGIFVLPRLLAEASGPSSVWALLVCGLFCVAVGLCFAEMAGIAGTVTGGPYRYACLAFGDVAGFAVGWIATASGVIGYAAVARALSERLVAVVDGRVGVDPSNAAWPVTAVAIAIITGLAAVNVAGVRAGARLSDFLAVVKVVPLVLLVVLGLPQVDPARLTPLVPSSSAGFWEATWLALFACSGFEYVSVPAGEMRDPRRDVARAVVGSIVGATVLYVLVQIVVGGVLPNATLTTTWAPLEAAAGQVAGPAFAAVLGGCAVVSMFGFCAGGALVGPRFVQAFARDKLLPSILARAHPRFGTPVGAIVASAAASIALASLLHYRSLVSFANLAIVGQYLPTCLAVVVLRVRRPALARPYRAPYVPVLPLAAVAMMTTLVAANVERDEVVMAGLVMLLGAVLYRIARARAAGPRGDDR